MGNEWALVFFTVLAGLGTGTFVGVGVSEWLGKAEYVRKPGAIVALVALPVSGFSSLLHLGRPERMFGALGHPTSGIFLEALMIGLTMVGVCAYLVALRKGATDKTRKMITAIAALPAIVLAFAVGDTYVMPSRPAWDTLVLPVAYVVSAAIMGCFSLGVLLVWKESVQATALRRTTLVVLAIQAVVTVAYLVALATAPYPDVTRSATRVLAGNLAPLFWIGIVLIGLLVPVALMMMKWQEKLPRPVALIGLVCTVIGAIAFRVMMFNLGTGIIQFFPA